MYMLAVPRRDGRGRSAVRSRHADETDGDRHVLLAPRRASRRWHVGASLDLLVGDAPLPDPCYNRPVMRRSALCALLLGACQPPRDAGGFGSFIPASTSTDGSTSQGLSSSTTHSPEASSTSTSNTSASSGSTGPRLDLGAEPDLEAPQPAGCKGKIDFLFVLSNGQFVESLQAQLIDAFPKFIDTITTKFADFDYHIMVVDGGCGYWGTQTCTESCPETPGNMCAGYPCDQLDKVTACDAVCGAGVVFNAGLLTLNKPCNVMGGHRYLTRGHPDLEDTFACMAQVGGSGGDRLGETLVAAVNPDINGPGGCNEGFLRDDALLVLTFATVSADYDSPGPPMEWAQAVVQAKHDDPNAIVAFGIGNSKSGGPCYDNDRVCQVVERFAYSHWISFAESDYGPGFDAATDLIEDACLDFIPQ